MRIETRFLLLINLRIGNWNVSKGLFIWAEVIPVSEKTFRQVYERDLENNMKSYIAFI